MWGMFFFNMWDAGLFALSFGALVLLIYVVLRVPRKFYKFGKVRTFALFTALTAWIIVAVIARSREIDTNNFQTFPNWLKIVYLLCFLTFVAVLISKINQDSKFSEKQEEKE